MNDFVLRGFCQNCGKPRKFPVDFAITGICSANEGKNHETVWFLSAKQIKILTQKFGQMFADHLATLLEENPVLVAKILKETKEKGENK